MRSGFQAFFRPVILSAAVIAVAWISFGRIYAQANHAATAGGPNASGQTTELSPEQIRAKFGAFVQQKAWTSPRITNPKAPEANASIIAVLRQQQQVAESEKAQILSAARSRNLQQGSTSHSSNPNAPLAPGRTESSNSGSTVKAGPGASTPGSKAAEVPVSNAICPPGAQPLLRTVDGQKSGVIFTPEATYTQMAPSNPISFFYTIEGCHFGDIAGHVALTGAFSKGKIDLAVDTWTGSGIVVHVPADLSGEFDQDNVTLTLTISGLSVQAPGFKFYAARDEVLLSSLPVREAALAGPQLRPNFPFFQSPGFGTFDVQRNSDTTYGPGTDHFSFDGLQRGFVPAAFQASRYAPLTADQCNYMVNKSGMQISFDGQWNAQWDGNRLQVDWPVAHCYASGYNEWAAWYGTKIWVIGPRGIDPWPSNMRLAPMPVTLPNSH
jgi:hypothetical protein